MERQIDLSKCITESRRLMEAALPDGRRKSTERESGTERGKDAKKKKKKRL